VTAGQRRRQTEKREAMSHSQFNQKKACVFSLDFSGRLMRTQGKTRTLVYTGAPASYGAVYEKNGKRTERREREKRRREEGK
jgi:hypothetical protein